MVWRRRAKRTLFWLSTITLILCAIAVGLIQLALPWWASDADRVARLLSTRLGSPVTIESTQPIWTSRGPVIELEGVRFGASDDARIDRAAWAIDFSGLVRPSRPFSEFRLHGVSLTVERDGNGRWSVVGLPELFKGESQPLSRVLRTLPAFALRDSALTVRLSPDKPALVLALPELRRLDGSVERWRGRIEPEAGSADGAGGFGSVQIALDLPPGDSAHLYIQADRLSLDAWFGSVEPMGFKPSSGRLDLQAWVEFDESGMRDLQIEFDQTPSTWRPPTVGGSGDNAPSIAAETQTDSAEADVSALPPVPDVTLTALRFGARLQREDGSHRLLIDDLTAEAGDSARLVGRGDGETFRLYGERLDAALFARLAVLADTTPAHLRRWLLESEPAGRISRLEWHSGTDGLRQVVMTLEGMHAAAGAGIPGIQGLDARLSADRDGAVLRPSGTGIVLAFPGVFAEPIAFDAAGGAIAAWRDGESWHIGADRLAIEGEGFKTRIEGGVTVTPNQPLQADLGVDVNDTDIEAVKRFWPINKIPNTARWLNKALLAGRVIEAHAWIRGPAKGFPFRDHRGRLDVVAEVADGGLNYHEDWPVLSGVEAELSFENATMRVDGRHVRIAGIDVADVKAEVPDLKQPILTVRAKARADGERIADFISQSPIQRRYGEYLDGMRIEGTPLADIDLRIPMKRELGDSSIDGRVAFAGERFFDEARGLQFDDLNGVLRFSRNGLAVEGMNVSLAGEKANLDLRIGNAVRDGSAALEADLIGRLSAGALFGNIQGLEPLTNAAQGRADWRVQLHVPDKGDASDGASAGWVRVESDLRGLALSLPAPLAKSADSTLPLRLRAGTQTTAKPIRVRLGQVLQLNARLASPGQPFAGTVALGGAEPEALPSQGLIVTGQVPALDLTGWLALDSRDDVDVPADTGVDWPQVVLRAGELGVWGRAFRDVDLQMMPDEDSVDVRLRGPDIEGTITWPKNASGRVVQGRFERLYVPAGEGGDMGGSLPPSAMPALDVEAQDVRVGVSRLGSTRLIARAQAETYRIETLESRSEAFDLDASGDWQRIDGKDRSDFDIRLRADDLGIMLESFGFAGLISGGETEATIDGQWAGSPAGFALEKIDGRLSVNIQSGRILEVDPGVGRIFGLLNLREIPRRLMLDFRDFFSQGMRFNSIQGTFALNVGEAYTDDMMLKSPSADILITGRTGLILRDYDQTLEVTPRMGGALPVVGAIAGGPAGAAAGLVVQGLLRIDDAAKIVYRVTGPWDDPVIIKQEPATSAVRRNRASDTMEPST